MKRYYLLSCRISPSISLVHIHAYTHTFPFLHAHTHDSGDHTTYSFGKLNGITTSVRRVQFKANIITSACFPLDKIVILSPLWNWYFRNTTHGILNSVPFKKLSISLWGSVLLVLLCVLRVRGSKCSLYVWEKQRGVRIYFRRGFTSRSNRQTCIFFYLGN